MKRAAIMMAVMMVVSILAGCSSTPSPALSATPSVSPSSSADPVSEDGRLLEGNLYLGKGTPIVKEPVTYTMMISYTLGKRDPNDMALYQERAKKTGINIEYEYVLASAVAERKALAFASDTMPDMMSGILSKDDVSTYGGSGALIALNDYIEKYCPRLQEVFTDLPEIEKAIRTPEGKIYGFPAPNQYSLWPGDGKMIVTSQMINKKWLDELEIPMPTTTDELIDVLKAFRDRDPNKNGKKDEIPYSFQYSDTWAGNFGETIFAPFGVIGPGTNKMIEDGKVVFAFQMDGYKDAIKYARTLHSEGLIDPEAFSQDASRYRAKGSAETAVYGLANGYTGDVELGATRIGLEVDGTVEYVPLPPLKGPTGIQIWNNAIRGINENALVITSSAKNPEVLMRYADEMYEPDNSVQEIYGMFNHQTEKLAEGKWRQIAAPEGWNVEEWLRDTTTRKLPSYISSKMAPNIYGSRTETNVEGATKKDNLKYRISSVFAPYAVDISKIYPPVIMSKDEADEIARILPQITNAIKEQEVNWILNNGDIDQQYDAFIKNLEGLQLSRIIELYQTAYERWIR